MGVYKRGDTWGISYFHNGKRIRKTIGTNKKKAEAELEAIRVDIRGGRYKEPRRDSFDSLVEEYERLQKGKKGYRSEKLYIGRVKEFFKDMVVQEIGILEVERFKSYMVELPTKNKNKPKRSGEDVNHHLNCLRAMLNNAVKWEWIEKNPALGGKVERLPISPGRNRYLTVEQAGKLLAACLPHLRPIVLCALETGMRKSEILGLRWREIKDGAIYLAGERTKNGKAREIPVSAPLTEEFGRLQRLRDAAKVVLASDLVFAPPRRRTVRRMGHLEVVTGPMIDIRSAFETAKKKAEIPEGFRFHDLRHTTASWLKMGGADDYTVMEILGHSDIKMMKRYAHLDQAHKRKALALLPGWTVENTWHKSGTNPESEEKGATG
ncbi:site-specific integrase [Candidatus Deferrimicrobium sp.]|uniref:tyrosine-type recombinase/integrase n=1 Tax=Candidatus Deferrimicrobium sp. TaxID=3060586 RepID=UPI002724A0E8|nr:site-specific integrase [Candidatus Deferrimicrobium sp.]MDO8738320.1 tyrosine-type recombinase/integrase [Candidatus Deferrimicrobium sp.]